MVDRNECRNGSGKIVHDQGRRQDGRNRGGHEINVPLRQHGDGTMMAGLVGVMVKLLVQRGYRRQAEKKEKCGETNQCPSAPALRPPESTKMP